MIVKSKFNITGVASNTFYDSCRALNDDGYNMSPTKVMSKSLNNSKNVLNKNKKNKKSMDKAYGDA